MDNYHNFIPCTRLYEYFVQNNKLCTEVSLLTKNCAKPLQLHVRICDENLVENIYVKLSAVVVVAAQQYIPASYCCTVIAVGRVLGYKT